MGVCLTKPVGDTPPKPQPPPQKPPAAADKSTPLPTLAGAAPPALPPINGQQLASADGEAPKGLQAPDEEGRLRAVRALQLIGAPPQPQFESITALMKQMFETPVAAVTLVDDDLHFISRAGDWACSAGRPGSFCEWILVPQTPQMLIVENALEDVRFKTNKFVAGDPRIRFYAGAPLVSSYQEGHRYGTLCVFDFKPRRFDASKYAMLAHFAEIVVREMERELAMMLQQREMGRARSAENHLVRAMDAFHEGILLLDLRAASWQVLYANDSFRAVTGLPHLLAPGRQDSGAPVDFWRLFAHASADSAEAYQAAVVAMATGRDFTLRVRLAAKGGRSGSSTPAAADGDADRVFELLFRPADAGQLRAGMPHVGVPAFVDEGEGGEEGEEGEDGGPDGVAAMRDMVTSAFGPSPSKSGRTPTYYFALVQGRAQNGSAAAAAAQPPAAQPPDAPPAVALDPATLSAVLGSEVVVSEAGPQLSGAAQLLPSFIAMRPEVMEEVHLGPLIGTGSMGRCYRGMWQGGRVAVKIIECWEPLPGARAPPLDAVAQAAAQGSQAAVVEALLARALSHPHIVTTFCHGMTFEEVPDLGRRHSQVWIVQEYCNRGSLLDAVNTGALHHPGGGPNLAAILLTAQEVAGACAYLHCHDVIHGDLTPSNVLLTSATKDLRRWTCKVCDFGLAKHAGGAKELHSSSFGTVTYMPPELVSEGKLSKAADVYSFGIILLEMFYGRRAWLGVPPLGILAKVSAGMLPFEVPAEAPQPLASLMRRCLDLDPARRPPFTAILAEVQGLLRTLSRPTSPEAGGGAGNSARTGGGGGSARTSGGPLSPPSGGGNGSGGISATRSASGTPQMPGLASPFASASRASAALSPFATPPPEPASP